MEKFKTLWPSQFLTLKKWRSILKIFDTDWLTASCQGTDYSNTYWCWLYNNSVKVASYSHLILLDNYESKIKRHFMFDQVSAQQSILTEIIIIWKWLIKVIQGLNILTWPGAEPPQSSVSCFNQLDPF